MPFQVRPDGPSELPSNRYFRPFWGVGCSDDAYAPAFIIHHRHSMLRMISRQIGVKALAQLRFVY
jgi:hypothetical protein